MTRNSFYGKTSHVRLSAFVIDPFIRVGDVIEFGKAL